MKHAFLVRVPTDILDLVLNLCPDVDCSRAVYARIMNIYGDVFDTAKAVEDGTAIQAQLDVAISRFRFLQRQSNIF